MCFYQSYAREMAEANGWRRLATNSAKLTNIIGGYGYKPALLSMEACVDGGMQRRQDRGNELQTTFFAKAGMGRKSNGQGACCERWVLGAVRS